MIIQPPISALQLGSQWFVREQELLGELASGPLLSLFDTAQELQNLYARSLKSGGIEGSKRVFCFKDHMFEQIKQEGLFADLLRWKEGRPFVDVSGNFTWPSTLAIAEPSDLPVLFLNRFDYTQLGCLAYFSVDVISLIQSVVSSKTVDKNVATIRRGENFYLPLISHDRARDVYYVNDGHNRLVAAQRAGHTHLLGRILFKDPLPKPHYSIGDVKVVPHEEYVAWARSVREDSWPLTIEGMLLRDGSGES